MIPDRLLDLMDTMAAHAWYCDSMEAEAYSDFARGMYAGEAMATRRFLGQLRTEAGHLSLPPGILQYVQDGDRR